MSINLIPLTYKTRNYFPIGANSFLLANAGQQVFQDQVRINLTFDFESSTDESVQINDQYSFKAIGFNWGDKGFVIGDSITFEYSLDGGAATSSGASTRTIIDIQGSIMFLSDFIILNNNFTGALMPMSAGSSNSNSVLKINNLSRSLPEQFEIYHNIVNNASNANKNSLIDGEQNRFLAENVDAMVPSDTITLFQQGNKSGGAYILAELTRTADLADGRKSFLVQFKYFATWKFEDSTFNIPSYLTNQQSLKPVYFVKAYPETNNPNAGLLIDGYGFNNGNVGWYEENYNGGEDDFLLTSLTITDSSGQIINEVDHNQTCTISGTFSGPSAFKDFIEGEFYIIPPTSEWKNNEFGHHENIFLASFTAELAGVVDSNSYGKNSGLVNSLNESITAIAGNELSFSFQLSPNSQFTSYINNLQDQERLYRISLTIESDGGTDNENNAVSKIVKEGVLTAAPIPDEPYDKVDFAGFYNHWQDISTGVSELTYKGTTEDDFVYKTVFNLEKSVLWEQMNLSVEVVRDSDGSSFILDSRTFNFNAFTMDSDGVIQFVGAANTQFIQQYLEAPERNQIKIFNTGVDTSTTYEVQVNWSLMANWRYWLTQSNAFLDFFDTALPNNGKNKEWVRYLDLAGFSIKLFSRLVKDGIAYFWVNNIDIDDYDSEAAITSQDVVYIDDQGVIQTVLVSGQDMIARADHVLSSGNWDQATTKGWISERGFEDEPNKRISTEWDWTSQSNPLKPKAGQTAAELTFPAPNIARVECLISTNLVDVDNATFVSRIKSPATPTCLHPIDYVFDYIEANATDDSQIVIVYNLLLNKVNANETNICCPTCEKLYNGGILFGDTTVFAIGGKDAIDAIIATSVDDPDDVCCVDGYKETYAFSRCDVDFDTHIGEINAILDGDTSFIDNSLIPTQMNSYTGTTELNKIKDRLESLTTDETIRYDLWREIIEGGLSMRCKTDPETGFVTKFLTRI